MVVSFSGMAQRQIVLLSRGLIRYCPLYQGIR
jgi:hypothetical protein